jgi:hypothetical protein
MPILSVAQAARLAQVDRATIRRKINAGILSASTRPDGGKGIELSELGGVLDVDRVARKLLIYKSLKELISTSGTPPNWYSARLLFQIHSLVSELPAPLRSCTL